MRAKAVERYLRLNGLIKPYKIETIGYGEDNLIDDKNPYSPINSYIVLIVIYSSIINFFSI